MIRPITIALAMTALLGAGATGQADPITYSFSGNFDQPLNGATQFSGSFTFNPNPGRSDIGAIVVSQSTPSEGVAQHTAYGFWPDPSPGSTPTTSEFGNEISLTVNMGGQTFHYANTPQNEFSTTLMAWFDRTYFTHGNLPPTDDMVIMGVTNKFTPGWGDSNNSFQLIFRGPPDAFYSNLSPGQVANLGNLDLASSVVGVTAVGSSGGYYFGKITSIEEVPAPEPGMLLVFAFLCVAARTLRPAVGREKHIRP